MCKQALHKRRPADVGMLRKCSLCAVGALWALSGWLKMLIQMIFISLQSIGQQATNPVTRVNCKCSHRLLAFFLLKLMLSSIPRSVHVTTECNTINYQLENKVHHKYTSIDQCHLTLFDIRFAHPHHQQKRQPMDA